MYIQIGQRFFLKQEFCMNFVRIHITGYKAWPFAQELGSKFPDRNFVHSKQPAGGRVDIHNAVLSVEDDQAVSHVLNQYIACYRG